MIFSSFNMLKVGGATIFILATLVLVNYSIYAEKEDEPMPAASLDVPDWMKRPAAPEGWIKIDEKSAFVSNKSSKDIFMLITDGENDLFVWFKKNENVWVMSILMSVPTKDHKKFGVNPSDIRIYINDGSVLYGVDGSQAIFIFRWIPKDKNFSIYVPG